MKLIGLDTNKLVHGCLAAAAMSLVACATAQPPKELVDAREAYARSEQGKAREFTPASLHEAKVALDKAELAFEEDPEAEATRDEAYVALRRAQRADIEASTASWQQRNEKAKSEATQAQAKAMEKAQSDLEAARQQLEKEKQARAEAEAHAKETLAKLSAREEARGTVITLSGGVLFASNKATLLPGAQSSLDQVAEAIKSQKDKKVLIEGHTDSRGSEATNQRLSKERADAVGQFLQSRGVTADRITTAGLAASRPVADNKTPEGRANNRRVEIVIQNMAQTAQSAAPAAPPPAAPPKP